MKNNVLAQIHSVAPTVSESINVCLSSTTVSKVNNALADAKKQTAEALASVIEHPNKRSLSGTRKSLTAIDNLLGGLMHGLNTRELSVKDFRAVCSNLKTSFIPKLENSISEEVDQFKAVAGIVNEPETPLTPDQLVIRDAILAAEKEVSEDEEETEYDRDAKNTEKENEKQRAKIDGITGDVERRLARLRALVTNLPNRLKMPYAIVKVPIAPHFETESAKNPTLLDKLAIPHSEIPLPGLGRDGAHGAAHMERYVIFEQQTVLCISKSYVEGLLTHKQGEQDEENDEEFKDIRARRRDLKAQLAKAESDVEAIEEKFKATPTQKPEIDRLTAKIRTTSREIEKALNASYTKEDKALLKEHAELDESIGTALRAIDARAKLYRDGEETKPKIAASMSEKERADILRAFAEDKQIPYEARYQRDMGVLQENLSKLDTEYDKLTIKVKKINKRYAKTASLNKSIEQIEIMERKLNKAKQLENVRLRMLPDAQQMVTRVLAAQISLEVESKAKRKAVKRSGPAITPEDYARSVLSLINERSQTKLAFVTTKAAPNPRNSRDILCYWLMPTTKLSTLMKHTGGKAKVMQWDFPFESERHVKPEDQRSEWVHPRQDKTHPEFLEYNENKAHRPSGWKSRYGAPVRRKPD